MSAITPSARAVATTVAYSATRHEAISASGPSIISASAMPKGHAASIRPSAVCSSRPRNQSATIRASMMLTSTPPMPDRVRPSAAPPKPPA